MICTEQGQLLFSYDSFTERNIDNALVSGLFSAIVALSSEVASSFPREIEFEGKILYFYKENELIIALLNDIESPFTGNILPLLLAKYKQVQTKFGFRFHDSIKYQNEVADQIKDTLAQYLSNIQNNMLSMLDLTDLSDSNTLLKLKSISKDAVANGENELLSFEVIARLIPEGFDRVIYACLVGIPVVVTGNRVLVEQVIHTLRILNPFKIMKVKYWTTKLEKQYHIVGTEHFVGIIPAHNLVVINLDEGVVLGGRSSTYVKNIAEQLSNLDALQGFQFLVSELQWVINILENLKNASLEKLDLPFEKMMLLFEIIKSVSV
ncbi:MAG: hypothetical protein ACTSYD_07685 [Candidatus Heimdallarchaeaceae archaeon]